MFVSEGFSSVTKKNNLESHFFLPCTKFSVLVIDGIEKVSNIAVQTSVNGFDFLLSLLNSFHHALCRVPGLDS